MSRPYIIVWNIHGPKKQYAKSARAGRLWLSRDIYCPASGTVRNCFRHHARNIFGRLA